MARPLNALMIDDSPTARKKIMQSLDQTALAEFHFTEAGDGIEALDKYAPGETEIVFVDMNMPRMDGLEFIHELRARYGKCPPTVMITAETDRRRLWEAMQEPGVDAFLLKPVDRDRLQAGLRKLVDSIPERSGPCCVPNGEVVAEAVEEIFALVCNTELTREPEDAYIRSGRVVLGMVGLHGDVHWSVTIGLPWQTSVAVASRFAGVVIEAGGEEMGDAIGELANMVGGRIKQLLGSKGLTASLSLPTVLGTAEFEVLLRHSVTDHTHFNSDAGRLWSMVAAGLDPGMIL